MISFIIHMALVVLHHKTSPATMFVQRASLIGSINYVIVRFTSQHIVDIMRLKKNKNMRLMV